MANTILLIGKSGTGKSTSLRNLPPAKTLIISPNAKAFPWKGASQQYTLGDNLIRESDMTKIPGHIKNAALGNKFNYVVIEDTTHLQNARLMSSRFSESKDWNKWNVFGSDMANLMSKDLEIYRDTLTIIYIAHVDTKEDGTIGIRTAGKLLDNTYDIPSYFTYIFHSLAVKKDGGKVDYLLQTNADGIRLAKTSMDMFDELFVENDIVKVLSTIADYTGVKTNV